MDPLSNQSALRKGAEVYGADGDKVGKIVEATTQYIVVEKGFFFPTDYYVPVSAVANAEGDKIYLNVTKDEALNRGWDVEPTGAVGETVPFDDTLGTGTSAGAYDASGTATYAAERDQFGTSAANAAGATGYMGESATTPGLAGDLTGDQTANRGTANAGAAGERPFEHSAHPAHTHQHTDDTLRIPVHEEELTATTRPVAQGEVRIGKDVVEEERTLEVPVTEERVRVSRRAVDRDAAPDAAAFAAGEVAVPVRGEAVDVQKRTRVAEEVEVGKEAVRRTERVADTVRKEQVRVEDATTGGDAAEPTDRDATAGGAI